MLENSEPKPEPKLPYLTIIYSWVTINLGDIVKIEDMTFLKIFADLHLNSGKFL